MKIYSEENGYIDSIKSFGWILIIIYIYTISKSNFVLYIGIFPLSIIFINIWRQKDRKVIIHVNEKSISIKSNEEFHINLNQLNKTHIELESKGKSKVYCLMKIKYNSNIAEVIIDVYESYKLISYLKKIDPLISIIDKRKISFSKQKIDYKNSIWENALGFIIGGTFLFIVFLKYDYFVNLKFTNPTTNVMIMEHLISFIDSLGGKKLMILLLGYLTLIFGLNSIISYDRK